MVYVERELGRELNCEPWTRTVDANWDAKANQDANRDANLDANPDTIQFANQDMFHVYPGAFGISRNRSSVDVPPCPCLSLSPCPCLSALPAGFGFEAGALGFGLEAWGGPLTQNRSQSPPQTGGNEGVAGNRQRFWGRRGGDYRGGEPSNQ